MHRWCQGRTRPPWWSLINPTVTVTGCENCDAVTDCESCDTVTDCDKVPHKSLERPAHPVSDVPVSPTLCGSPSGARHGTNLSTAQVILTQTIFSPIYSLLNISRRFKRGLDLGLGRGYSGSQVPGLSLGFPGQLCKSKFRAARREHFLQQQQKIINVTCLKSRIDFF